MNHWTFIEDSFIIKGRGLVAMIFLPYDFQINVGDAATLFAPNGTNFTTRVTGGEVFRRKNENQWRAGIGLAGFTQDLKMANWLMVVHTKITG